MVEIYKVHLHAPLIPGNPYWDVVTKAEYDALAAELAEIEMRLAASEASNTHYRTRMMEEKSRIAALEAAIREHNEGVLASCGESNEHNCKLKGCDSYLPRGRQCPDCPKDWLIPTQSTERPASETDAERCKHGVWAADRCEQCVLESEAEVTRQKAIVVAMRRLNSEVIAERDALAAELAREKEQHACTVDVLGQTRTELADAKADYLRRHKDAVDRYLRIQALEAALRDIEYNANYNGHKHIWQMAKAALEPTASETDAVRVTTNFGPAVCQHDRTRPEPTLRWLGSSMDPNASTHLFHCTVCHHSFDLPIGRPQSEPNNADNCWQPIEDAPHGVLVEVLNEDGDIDQAEWRNTRQCMLASVARGAGECGPGWVSRFADYLPIDPPLKWRPLPPQMTTPEPRDES